MNRNRHADGSRCLAQERAFAAVGLDQMDIRRTHGGENQSREAGAAAEVDKRRRGVRDERKQLRRIEHVPAPQIRQGGLSDQIDPPVPFAQQVGVALQALECFT